MRIAIFTDVFYPKIDGVVVYTADLAKAMADRGHEVVIIAPKYEHNPHFKYPNVTLIRTRSIPADFLYDEYKLASPLNPRIVNRLKAMKIDIIHFHTPMMLGLLAILTAKTLRVPLVGTFHCLVAESDYLKHARLDNKFMSKLVKMYLNLYFNRCDMVTCPSESAKMDLRKSGFRKSSVVIPHGLTVKKFHSQGIAAARRKFDGDGGLALFFGRIAYEKRISYLLDCFSLVLRKMPKAKFLVIGYGPQMADAKAKARSLGISRSVIFTGKISHDRLMRSGYIGASDVFLNASVTETGPITAIEAQACGVPCVSVRARGVRDIVEDRKTGFLVPNGDKRRFAAAVIRLMSDHKLRARMSKAALLNVRKYDVDVCAKHWESLYHSLIKKKKRRSERFTVLLKKLSRPRHRR